MYLSRFWGDEITPLKDFDKGLNVVISESHSQGKSTLVTLIEFMLFGNDIKNSKINMAINGNIYLELTDFKHKYFIFKRNMGTNEIGYLKMKSKKDKLIIEKSNFINSGIKNIRKEASDYFNLLDDSRPVYRYNVRFDNDYDYSSILFPRANGPSNSNDKLLINILGYNYFLDDLKSKKRMEKEKESISNTISVLSERDEKLIIVDQIKPEKQVEIIEEIRELNNEKYIYSKRLRHLKQLTNSVNSGEIEELKEFYGEISDYFKDTQIKKFEKLVSFNDGLREELDKRVQEIEVIYREILKDIKQKNKYYENELKSAENKLEEIKNEKEKQIKILVDKNKELKMTDAKKQLETKINSLNKYFQELDFEFGYRFNKSNNIEFDLLFKKDNKVVHEIEGETWAKLFSLVFSYSIIKETNGLPNFLILDSIAANLNETDDIWKLLVNFINFCKEDKDFQLVLTMTNNTWERMQINGGTEIVALSDHNYLLKKAF